MVVLDFGIYYFVNYCNFLLIISVDFLINQNVFYQFNYFLRILLILLIIKINVISYEFLLLFKEDYVNLKIKFFFYVFFECDFFDVEWYVQSYEYFEK